MALVALLIGAIIVVAAVRNTQSVLFGALAHDLPDFMVWGAAIFAVGAIGFIPGLNPVSRGLLALVLLVIVLTNYQKIIQGLSQPLNAGSAPSGGGASGSGATDGPGSIIGNIVGQFGGLSGGGDFTGSGLSSAGNGLVLH